MKKPHTQSILKQALLTVHHKLTACDIPHALTFGTLLGIMRSGGPVPGDNDVDFMIPEAPGVRTAILRCLGQPWEASMCPTAEIPAICEQQFQSRYYMPYLEHINGSLVLIDFYWASQTARSSCFCWDFYAMPKSTVFPFEPLGGKLAHLHPSLVGWLGGINGPHLAKEFVELLYGKEWMVPLQDWEGLHSLPYNSGRGLQGGRLYECCERGLFEDRLVALRRSRDLDRSFLWRARAAVEAKATTKAKAAASKREENNKKKSMA